MAYRIKHRDASTQAAVRRIARAQVKRALRCIDAAVHDPATIVHDVRKRCKKIRGLLRLVRPAFDDYRSANTTFREIAAQLGPLRDAEVLVAAFDHVIAATVITDAGEVGDAGDAERFAAIRRQLLRRRTVVADNHDAGAVLAAARDALDAALRRIDNWHVARDGFDAFEDGLVSSYRRGRKAMRVACKRGGDEAFHDWRKRCKDHAFHLRLLGPIWPGPMSGQYACAAELGDLLGQHHDLAVLARHTRDMGEVDQDVVDAFVACVRTRQAGLAQRADSLGARLYAEPPAALAKSWRRRYAAWRAELQGG